MDTIDKAILLSLSGDIEICENPFERMAKRIGIGENELITRVNQMIESGQIKRIAPILYHQKTKFSYNTLLAMQVAPEDVGAVVTCLSAFGNVSHIYERKVYERWPFNVYGMCHGTCETDIDLIIQEVKNQVNLLDLKRINTLKEWKKTSPDLDYLLK